MTKNIHQVFLAAALAMGAPALAADAIAFITNMKGDVAVDGNARPLLLSELARGQRLTLGKDSSASVMYIASGKEYLLKGPAEYQVRDTEVAGSTPMPPLVRSTEWRTNSKVLVQVAQTAAASVRMRSIPKPKQEPALIYPTEGNVATLQPTFRWRAADPKQPGDLVIHAVGEEKAVHVAKVSGGAYRLPLRLKPETDYSWSYALAGAELGSGQFRTVSADHLKEIEKHRPAEKAHFSDRLLFALMLQDIGAAQDAREAWARLAEERTDLPELSALAK